jgi:hypothetical protein
MRATSVFGALAVASFGLASAACGNGDDTFVLPPPPTKVADGGSDATVVPDADADDASPADAGSDAVTVSSALVRVANWSANAPPVDFCLAPHGTGAFQRPALAALVAALDDAGGDAGLTGVPFPQASAYFPVPPGPYDARLVVGGASDCSAKLVDDATDLPAFAPGQPATVALIGSLGADGGVTPLTVVGFADDSTTKTDGGIGVRAINAVTGLHTINLELGTLAAASGAYKSIFVGMAYGTSSSMAANASIAKVDPQGYGIVPPVDMDGVAVRPSGAPNNAALAAEAYAAAGSVVTFVMVDQPLPTGTSPSAQLVQCVDNAGTIGLTGTCSIISE